MNKYVTSLFFLLFCRGISVFAIENQPSDGSGTFQYNVYANSEFFVEEEKKMLLDTIQQRKVGIEVKDSVKIGTINQQIGGNHNNQYIITNHIFKNKKELAGIEKKIEQSNAKLDNFLFMQKRIEEEMEKMKTVLHGKMLEKDSVYQALQREREKLQKEYDALVLRVEELDSIIQLQKKGNFLPLGIKQFRNDKKALGRTFLVSEIAVPVALGVGLGCAAHQNYRKHKAQEAQTLSDHRDYYKKYKNYHRAAIWAPVVAEALVYGVNVLCNYYCPVKKPDVALRPTVGVDCRGNVQAGIGISFNF